MSFEINKIITVSHTGALLLFFATFFPGVISSLKRAMKSTFSSSEFEVITGAGAGSGIAWKGDNLFPYLYFSVRIASVN